ncbi:TolC family protein [Nitratifractor salsuginis]|uniref:Outer membrane efflux protein n=1 Tax=Nitratifractor salsuginis (strain DSM 16511 / JCM 12458 / E9I37-1) TaxID=749222 RepID=E6X131_NITSE|nr:TolC family protein [Nitratifractor salsuginis]ADV45834.1 outer membrane efflux protein [Nitratifractor salsuginis DSM 16511]
MLKRTLIPLLLGSGLYAASVSQLLDGVRHHYQAQLDNYSIQEADKALEMVRSQFWPKIRIFGSATHYNAPTNLRPATPTENAKLSPQAGGNGDYPFSTDIYRVGATLSMPIFVANLFTLADQTEAMRHSAAAKKEVDLLKNEATVLGANANLRYLEQMKASLHSKAKTLRTTEAIVKAKVKAGRAPASALYKVQDRLDSIRIALDNIEVQKENIRTLIETLSGVTLSHSAPMRQKGNYRPGPIFALKPLQAKRQADELAAKAEQEKLYPSLHLDANINRGYGDSYFSGHNIHRDYGGIGLTLSAPLLDMPQIRSMQKARIHAMKSATELAKTADELKTKAKAMRRQLGLLRHALSLHRHNISNEKKLVEIARRSYEDGRMTLEEYLRYIDSLYDAKAELYKTRAAYWQTLAQLAFLYGNRFERIVR